MKNSETNHDFSSIKKLEKIVVLSLPITFISNEKAGVIEVLDSWIRQHNEQLEGILVSYSNVSLLSRRNFIEKDNFRICAFVKATFDLFCPNVGDIVKGKINRISKEHIGCLMHDTINVAIKLTEYCPNEINKFIRLEQDVLFEITHFVCKRACKEIRVRGKFTPECLKLMNDLFPVVEEEAYLTNLAFSNQNTITHYDSDGDVKDIYLDTTSNNTVSTSQNSNDVSSINGFHNLSSTSEDSLYKKKKSKKHKKDSSPNVTEHIENIFEASEIIKNSSESPNKMSKKRKRDDSDSADTSSFTEKNSKKCKINIMDDAAAQNLYSAESNEDILKISKKSKKHKADVSTEIQSKKKKKVKRDKKDKKKDKLKLKKNKLIASGSVLKADKKKHSKKEKNKKSNSKGKKKHKNASISEKIKTEN